jgi:hypothetical protein
MVIEPANSKRNQNIAESKTIKPPSNPSNENPPLQSKKTLGQLLRDLREKREQDDREEERQRE